MTSDEDGVGVSGAAVAGPVGAAVVGSCVGAGVIGAVVTVSSGVTGLGVCETAGVGSVMTSTGPPATGSTGCAAGAWPVSCGGSCSVAVAAATPVVDRAATAIAAVAADMRIVRFGFNVSPIGWRTMCTSNGLQVERWLVSGSRNWVSQRACSRCRWRPIPRPGQRHTRSTFWGPRPADAP